MIAIYAPEVFCSEGNYKAYGIIYNAVTRTKIAIALTSGDYEIIDGNQSFFYAESNSSHPKLYIEYLDQNIMKYDSHGKITSEWRKLQKPSLLQY